MEPCRTPDSRSCRTSADQQIALVVDRGAPVRHVVERGDRRVAVPVVSCEVSPAPVDQNERRSEIEKLHPAVNCARGIRQCPQDVPSQHHVERAGRPRWGDRVGYLEVGASTAARASPRARATISGAKLPATHRARDVRLSDLAEEPGLPAANAVGRTSCTSQRKPGFNPRSPTRSTTTSHPRPRRRRPRGCAPAITRAPRSPPRRHPHRPAQQARTSPKRRCTAPRTAAPGSHHRDARSTTPRRRTPNHNQTSGPKATLGGWCRSAFLGCVRPFACPGGTVSGRIAARRRVTAGCST